MDQGTGLRFTSGDPLESLPNAQGKPYRIDSS
jgi:hypothetical protein